MSSRVHEAIVARWDAQSLDTTFTGGLWFQMAPSGTAFPYVVFFDIGSAPQSWTSSSEIRSQIVQFDIFLSEDNLNDPASQLGSHMRTLDAAIGFAPLSIPASDGHILEVRRTAERITREDQGIWHGSMDYTIRRGKPVDPSPA